jgi:glutathione S-transferase
VTSADENKDAIYKINELTFAVPDGLSNEPHDCHHPVATHLHYEDQKEESKLISADYIANRIPKLLGYFKRVLKAEASKGGKFLYRGKLVLF